jgi:hypothetical protein
LATSTFQTDAERIQRAYVRATEIAHRCAVDIRGRRVFAAAPDLPIAHQDLTSRSARILLDVIPDVALNSIRLFIDNTHSAGMIPASLSADQIVHSPLRFRSSFIESAAAVAFRLRDETLARDVYRVGSDWDIYLEGERNRLGVGLMEMFNDAERPSAPPEHGSMPALAADLTATLYAGRCQLAKLADALRRSTESAAWAERAAAIRERCMAILFDFDAGVFFDRNDGGRIDIDPVPVLLSSLAQELVDAPTAMKFWPAWFGAMCAASISRADRLDELTTAARRYRRDADVLVKIESALPSLDINDLSAAAFVVDSVSQLYGVVNFPDQIEWNCRPPVGATHAVFETDTPAGVARIESTREGSLLYLNQIEIGMVNGVARLVTDFEAQPVSICGTASQASSVRLHFDDIQRLLLLQPNELLAL